MSKEVDEFGYEVSKPQPWCMIWKSKYYYPGQWLIEHVNGRGTEGAMREEADDMKRRGFEAYAAPLPENPDPANPPPDPNAPKLKTYSAKGRVDPEDMSKVVMQGNPVHIDMHAKGDLTGSGVKHDSEKLRLDLLPWDALEPVARVLQFGAKKYDDDNWRKVPDQRRRYFAAALRHLSAWKRGEKIDPESGLPHLAHAACCVLFLIVADEAP